MSIKRLSLIFYILLLNFNVLAIQDSKSDVIYGTDDRHEVENYPDDLIQSYSHSVAGMVFTQQLFLDEPDSNEKIDFYRETLSETNPHYCPNMRFNQQFTLPRCTGFLVAKDVLLTAGHCVDNASKCSDDYRWIFNYTSKSDQINLDDIYKCKKIITSKFIQKRKKIIHGIASALISIDYALIILEPEKEKNNTQRHPLPFRKTGRPLPYTPVLTLGHPLGLPMKIADNAYLDPILKLSDNPIDSFLFGFNRSISNLDNFVGNSGSPVINVNTGRVEGLLLGGADDMVNYSPNPYRKCLKTNRLENTPENFQEEVLLTASIPELKNIEQAKKKKTEIIFIDEVLEEDQFYLNSSETRLEK